MAEENKWPPDQEGPLSRHEGPARDVTVSSTGCELQTGQAFVPAEPGDKSVAHPFFAAPTLTTTDLTLLFFKRKKDGRVGCRSLK